MVSRVLGLVRDMLIAIALGAGATTDAFVVALLVPNLFRRIFGEGALASAFVPCFTGALQDQGTEAAHSFARALLGWMGVVLSAVVVLVWWKMEALLALVAPGFDEGSERFRLAADLARVMAPYLLCICVVAALGGVLNSLGRFVAMR